MELAQKKRRLATLWVEFLLWVPGVIKADKPGLKTWVAWAGGETPFVQYWPLPSKDKALGLIPSMRYVWQCAPVKTALKR